MADQSHLADPFGLRSLSIERLRAKHGAKWAAARHGWASWVADMDFDVAPPVRDALREVVEGDEFGYPDWGGLHAPSPAAPLFVERMAQRYGWEPAPDRTHEMADVLQAVRVAIHHLSRPGDGVVLHMPAYYPFLDTISGMGRTLVGIEPTDDGFDYDRLDAELRKRPGAARVWILCHPHNPLGRVFERRELERVAELALAHDLIVISDEIHADLTFAPARHIPFATLSDEVAARTVTVTSASKAFNLAGLRWAVLHATCDALHRELEALPAHYLGAANVMAVTATVAAWRAGDPWLNAVHEVLDENRRGLVSLLAEHLPGARYRPSAATYLAWVDLTGCAMGDDPGLIFRDRGVVVSSGIQFGPQGAGCVRLNLATSPTILAATVAAMGGA